MFGAVLSLCLLASPPFSFDRLGPYNQAVPDPEKLLGYPIGSRHTTYFDQDRVLNAITASVPSRIQRIDFGKSTEGRPLRLIAISSPQNMARLEQIRQDHLALANPKPGQKDGDLAKRTPAIVWVNECIHGDETASFESAMELIYNLAASRNASVNKILNNTVVLVNPSYNPDGHERYVVAYNSIPNGNPEPGSYDGSIPFAFFGRANHYRFDMNRDRIAISQAETRQEVAEFQRWFPQVYIDQHGQVENYFFPPVQQSINVNVDRQRYIEWTNIFGKATANSFDQNGWSYYVRDQFDFYNACYLDTCTTLMGAIGMTQETNGGRVISSRQGDDTLVTLTEGAAKHFTSAFAVITAASEHHDDLMASFSKFKQDSVSGAHAGKFRRVVVESEDVRPLQRLRTHLGRFGITSYFATSSWEQSDAHDYWTTLSGTHKFPAHSLVVDMAQSQGPLAKALLEPQSDFEPEFIARQKAKAKADEDEKPFDEIDSFEFYDTTAWALPLAYNLKAWWCESTPVVSAGEPQMALHTPAIHPVGYYLNYSDQDDVLFVARALLADVRVSLATKQIRVGGNVLEPGTFMFLSARNDDQFQTKLIQLAKDAKVDLQVLPTSFPDTGRQGPGSESVRQLKKPKIGIVFGSAGSLNGGAIWYQMEQEFCLPFLSLDQRALSQHLDDFSCIVIPAGVRASASGELTSFVQSGGCVVALGGANWGLGDNGFAKLESTNVEPDLPGSQFRAQLDSTSILSYGYAANGGAICIPIDGSSFYKAPKGGSAVMLDADPKVRKLISGWTWDTTEKDLAGTAWAVDQPVGRGRAVLFLGDPTFRDQWPGLNKMVLNAMILGPGR